MKMFKKNLAKNKFNPVKSHARTILSIVLEPLESRTMLSATYEPIDGVGNNAANPLWGSAGTDLIRLSAAAYADGIASPSLPANLSAREISNILNNQADPNNPTQDLSTVSATSLSDFGYAFGQFMDHDMDLTPNGGASLPIFVAPGDPIGPDPLPFNRSTIDPATGTSTSNPAEQITTITAYLDLSQVYGSSQDVADALRTMQGGLLKTSPGNMLPYDNTTYFSSAQITALNMANDAQAVPTSALFATGDRRGNENLELTTLETLFVRNHNKIAGEVQAENPTWTDEQIYQEARKLNIAEYQNIIYNGWIPAVMGPDALPAYTGYNAAVNASISTEFSTVAFRFGHSLLSDGIERTNNDGSDIADVSPDGADVSLAFDFFDPNLLSSTGAVDPLTGHTSSDIGPVLKGEADGVSNANDLMAIGDVRNLLFGNGGLGGQDLIALDVERGRDDGIPGYNTVREALGLPAVTSFAQISSNPTVQQALAEAYPGGVNTVDAFEGGEAEAHVAGSNLGPLFQAILADQFTRLRDGDSYFYLNETFNAQEKQILAQGATLGEVIEANTDITNLQPNVFEFTASISGNVAYSVVGALGLSSCPYPTYGLTVQLEDAAGNVVATTRTDSKGNYIFTQQSGGAANPDGGLGLSSADVYKVVLVQPSGVKLESALPAPTDITVGGTQVSNVNFKISNAVTRSHEQAAKGSGFFWG